VQPTGTASAQRAENRVRKLRADLEAAQLQSALSYYTAANKGRGNRDWKASPVSADQAIIPDAQTLIARSRVTVANTWIGKAAVRSQKRNVVGRGIMVVPVAKDAKGNELPDVNRQAGDAFMRWASDKTACDLERRRTFWQIQRMAVSEEFVAGESFIVWSYVPNPRTVGLRLQMFEPEQLDLTIQSFGENQVRGGVEIDEYGAAVAFHFYERNPNDYLIRNNYRSIRIPAERVFHYFDAERVLQTRGATHMAPVLQDIRDFSSFKDATLWRARMEACIGMIIQEEFAEPERLADHAAATRRRHGPDVERDAHDRLRPRDGSGADAGRGRRSVHAEQPGQPVRPVHDGHPPRHRCRHGHELRRADPAQRCELQRGAAGHARGRA
jgi:lambda family phage portal protein